MGVRLPPGAHFPSLCIPQTTPSTSYPPVDFIEVGDSSSDFFTYGGYLQTTRTSGLLPRFLGSLGIVPPGAHFLPFESRRLLHQRVTPILILWRLGIRVPTSSPMVDTYKPLRLRDSYPDSSARSESTSILSFPNACIGNPLPQTIHQEDLSFRATITSEREIGRPESIARKHIWYCLERPQIKTVRDLYFEKDFLQKNPLNLL